MINAAVAVALLALLAVDVTVTTEDPLEVGLPLTIQSTKLPAPGRHWNVAHAGRPVTRHVWLIGATVPALSQENAPLYV